MDRNIADQPESSAQPARENQAQEPQPGSGAQASSVPPGWTYNPSSWPQRVPIIAIACINFAIATYLAVCQIANLPVWDPFFGSGSYRVLHSSVSHAFPLPDAAMGAAVYLLEAIFGLLGDTGRWHTKPWLALTFALFVVPLSAVSILLLILQPVAVGAWCTLCLVMVAGILVMVPLMLDEVIAAVQFLMRSAAQGKSLVTLLWQGDAGATQSDPAGEKAAREGVESGLLRGISTPWNLILCAGLGVWLLIEPAALGTYSSAADSSHVAGALTLTFSFLAFAEVARPVRFMLLLCGGWLLAIEPWTVLLGTTLSLGIDACVGTALICLCYPSGRVHECYDGWHHIIAWPVLSEQRQAETAAQASSTA